MFDIGFQELLLCALIALIVLGPRRLPEAARTAGRWIGQARRFINSVQNDLQNELRTEDLREFRRLKEELDETRQALNQVTGDLGRSLNERVDLEESPPATAAQDSEPALTQAPETAQAQAAPEAPPAVPEPAAKRAPRSRKKAATGAGKTARRATPAKRTRRAKPPAPTDTDPAST